MSFGYALVRLILKLKREKRSWSQTPVDYYKKRKQNITIPKSGVLKGCSYKQIRILNTCITKLTPKVITNNQNLIFYCHGGAFIYGPTQENWRLISEIAQKTGQEAWLIDYPKAPENTIKDITKNVYNAYQEALKTYAAEHITLIGDSAGGNLVLTLAQRLVKQQQELPKNLILITPVVEATLTNKKIKNITKKDPVLDPKGVLWAKKVCAGTLSLKDPLISPLYGNIEKLPRMHVFMATDDILNPDIALFVEKARNQGNNIEVIIGEGMPHVWPLFPIMNEAKKARQKLITIIKDDGVG